MEFTRNSVIETVVVFDTFQKDNGNTKVWHQGLCHMSEKGLFVLSMQWLLDGAEMRKLKFCETF